jgi:hypothetical protein
MQFAVEHRRPYAVQIPKHLIWCGRERGIDIRELRRRRWIIAALLPWTELTNGSPAFIPSFFFRLLTTDWKGNVAARRNRFCFNTGVFPTGMKRMTT